MSILNKLTKPPEFEGDLNQIAIELLDKIFPFIPEYDSLELRAVIRSSNLSQEEKQRASQLSDKIEILLFNKFEYAEKNNPSDYYGHLSKLGRQVKSAGGHVAYLKQLSDEKDFQRKKDEADLANKLWTYKTRQLPFFISGGALLISIIAVIFAAKTYYRNAPINPSKKETEQPQVIEPVKGDTFISKDTVKKTRNPK